MSFLLCMCVFVCMCVCKNWVVSRHFINALICLLFPFPWEMRHFSVDIHLPYQPLGILRSILYTIIITSMSRPGWVCNNPHVSAVTQKWLLLNQTSGSAFIEKCQEKKKGWLYSTAQGKLNQYLSSSIDWRLSEVIESCLWRKVQS